MDIFYTPSMLWGPIRISLFIIFVHLISIVIARRVSQRRGLDYFIMRLYLFISVLIISSMILTQINSYDLFVILVGFCLIIVFTFLNLNFKRPIGRQLKKIQTRFIIYTIRTFEYGNRFLGRKNFRKKAVIKYDSVSNNKENLITESQLNSQIIIGVVLGIMGFASRYYFFYFDTYLLSDIWYSDLSNLKDITKEHWFFHQGTMMGQFSVINFYSKITNITDAVALTSFGLIESTLLIISLFWAVNKLTKTKIITGLIAAGSYIFLYAFLPLNINLITQPKSIFFGFSIVLLLIVYAFNPQTLTLNTKKYFRLMFIFFLSLTYIDLFLTLFIIPLLIVIAFLFNYRTFKELMFKMLSSYLLAIFVSFTILLIAATVQQKDLLTFLNSNLYSYSNYTYSPQLILPLEQLLDLYFYLSSGLLLLAFLLFRIDRTYKLTLMISLFIFVCFTLPKANFYFIDSDLLNQVLAICTPILFSLTAYAIYTIFRLTTKTSISSKPLKLVSSCVIIVFAFFGVGNESLIKYPKKNPVNEEVIKVYDKMNSDLLPFSYTVVNNYLNSRLGENKHYFLNYSYFAKDYLEKDAIYVKNKGNDSYFKKNPDHVLPQSTFVFIYSDEAVQNIKNGLRLEEQQASLKSINILKQKGRNIAIYYETSMLTVYEIINNPKSSKISDLLL